MTPTRTKSQVAREKFDALINRQTPAQLVALWKHARGNNTPEGAIVRGALYSRLCVLVGDDRADELCE